MDMGPHINYIELTKEDILARVKELETDLEKRQTKEMIKLIKSQIEDWQQRLDWFYLNEAETDHDYGGPEESAAMRASEGYTPYAYGYTEIGNFRKYNY